MSGERAATQAIPNWRGHYTPWIGCEYRTQTLWADTRLLILGESHYFGEPEDDKPSATIDLVEEAVNGEGRPYFNKVPEVVSGKQHLTMDERARVWRSVAFSNICQEAAGDDHVPKPGAFEKSKPALYQLVGYLKPTHVLFISKRAWDNTHWDHRFRKISCEQFPVPSRKSAFELCRAKIDEHPFWTAYILHPTSGRPLPPFDQSSAVVDRLLAAR